MKNHSRAFKTWSRKGALAVALCAVSTTGEVGQIFDANGDGQPDLVVRTAPEPGYAQTYFSSGGEFPPNPGQRVLGTHAPHWGTGGVNLGDLNGDGFSDVVITGWYVQGAGKVYLHFGGVTGISVLPQVISSPVGLANGAVGVQQGQPTEFGYAIASPGDVNGDGFPDLAVGSNGGVFIYAGGRSGFNATPLQDLRSPLSGNGSPTGDRFGNTMGAIGDINGDGRPDLAVGALLSHNLEGRAYVYYGNGNGFDNVPVALDAPVKGFFGRAFSSGDDLNQDGYSDIVVSAIRAKNGSDPRNPVSTGRVYVYYGGPAGVNAWPDQTILSKVGRGGFGTTIHSVGDFTGDGFPDVVVTDDGVIPYGPTDLRVAVFAGGAGGLSSAPYAEITGLEWLFNAATDVTGLGDLNNDGAMELAVRQPDYKGIKVYAGGQGGVISTPLQSLNPPPDGTANPTMQILAGYNVRAMSGPSLNSAPVASAGGDIEAGAGANCEALVELDGSASSDPDGDELVYTWTGVFGTATGASPTVLLPLGEHEVELLVRDGKGGSARDVLLVKVEDKTSPIISAARASVSVIWPPNHQMVPVDFTIVTSDSCDLAPNSEIISATSNEVDEELGDGDFANDIEITGALSVRLRAERSGKGNGRIYTVRIGTKDVSGNTTYTRVEVVVPKKSPAVAR